jgi:hypothetical protein
VKLTDFHSPEQAAINLRASQIAAELEAEGYGLIILQLARVADRPGSTEVFCPGTTLIVAKESIYPILQAHAQTLREVADEMDAAFARAEVEPAESATIECKVDGVTGRPIA